VPRPKGDHEARRREVSEAVWRVLIARGFDGLTLRAVAAEMDATTGLLTHYFPGKRDLVAYALDLLEQRSDARPRRTAAAGLPALRSALLDMLPLTDESAETSRIWVSSWDTALADPAWSIDYARKYAQSREKLHALVAAAQRLSELPGADADRLAASAQSFVLGLSVQSLIDPAAFPPQRQIELLDGYLADLAPTSVRCEAVSEGDDTVAEFLGTLDDERPVERG
jgi:AcrR family transcriptional regulator